MSINADWQDVLAAVALAASEKQVASSIPPVMPPELPRVIMRAAHAAEMGATTGPPERVNDFDTPGFGI
jgi:hypothetical protein